ncbi:hypothetical protein BN174_4120002 [Clostridioides difficile E15]|nr:hypothetical protein BN174_4120002 [Clostridioides difficile E15]
MLLFLKHNCINNKKISAKDKPAIIIENLSLRISKISSFFI